MEYKINYNNNNNINNMDVNKTTYSGIVYDIQNILSEINSSINDLEQIISDTKRRIDEDNDILSEAQETLGQLKQQKIIAQAACLKAKIESKHMNVTDKEMRDINKKLYSNR